MREGSSWRRRRWPQAQPNPGVWWRRRRRRGRAPQRSGSNLWGGKAARNLPDRPLHPPPTSHFPPPRSSSLLPPSSPKPAASTDLSNGCTFLGAGRRVAERLNPGSNARERPRATPARLAPRRRRPWALGEAVRKPSQEGRGGRHLHAAGAPSLHLAGPPASGARTRLAPGSPSRQTAGGQTAGGRGREEVLSGRKRVN